MLRGPVRVTFLPRHKSESPFQGNSGEEKYSTISAPKSATGKNAQTLKSAPLDGRVCVPAPTHAILSGIHACNTTCGDASYPSCAQEYLGRSTRPPMTPPLPSPPSPLPLRFRSVMVTIVVSRPAPPQRGIGGKEEVSRVILRTSSNGHFGVLFKTGENLELANSDQKQSNICQAVADMDQTILRYDWEM